MTFEIFLTTAPGLENALYDEVRGKGFKQVKVVKGGVTLHGGWSEVWRANLWVRGASRVLARIASFKALHLSQLEMQARAVAWGEILKPDMTFSVKASCVKSRIYHSDAAAERVEKAISDTLKAAVDPQGDITIMLRIERDICTLSVDTSGELLHKRGFKEQVNKAPMRENMAALFLQECGFKGDEPVYDPMCGSGTFVIEAAEIAARLNPGRQRAFAFESLATFDAEEWQKMRTVQRQAPSNIQIYGSDRDEGAIAMSQENASRAGVAAYTHFVQKSISDITPPCEAAGLIILNPPYGTRIGEVKKLLPLYQTLGEVLRTRFSGWRVGIITADKSLAAATKLPFLPEKQPILHGGTRINLYQTKALPQFVLIILIFYFSRELIQCDCVFSDLLIK